MIASHTLQLDCGFDCPYPPTGPNAQPPVSATIAHPFPNAPVTAIGGSTTFSNTYITTSPTTGSTLPVIPPVPTYATGRCSVQLRQYQKHEGATSENNTNDFKIKVLLLDAKGNSFGQDAIVPAPAGTPVSISGLASPLVATLTGFDSDPVAMSFGTQAWKSGDKQCNVGGYGHGSRAMTCTFDC